MKKNGGRGDFAGEGRETQCEEEFQVHVERDSGNLRVKIREINNRFGRKEGRRKQYTSGRFQVTDLEEKKEEENNTHQDAFKLHLTRRQRARKRDRWELE
jgi:hypothetical protein